MITININIDNEIFEEASSILDSFGMTMDIAINLFINNIIKSKGFPIELKQKDAQEVSAIKTDKVKARINEDMIEVVWEKFKKLLKGESSVIESSDQLESETGMNKGSAFIYLTILTNMVQGKENTRNMKVKDFEFFLNKIKEELGNEAFQNSLKTLRETLPYWEKKGIAKFAASVRDLIDSFQQ
jgi:addiction module RelB/DinJ family antitoxin